MSSPGSLILVTGANGFIGTHAVANLLENGYSVRAVVRSQDFAETVSKTFKESSDKISAMVVPSITTEGVLDGVVKGIDGVSSHSTPLPSGPYGDPVQLACLLARNAPIMTR